MILSTEDMSSLPICKMSKETASHSPLGDYASRQLGVACFMAYKVQGCVGASWSDLPALTCCWWRGPTWKQSVLVLSGPQTLCSGHWASPYSSPTDLSRSRVAGSRGVGGCPGQRGAPRLAVVHPVPRPHSFQGGFQLLLSDPEIPGDVPRCPELSRTRDDLTPVELPPWCEVISSPTQMSPVCLLHLLPGGRAEPPEAINARSDFLLQFQRPHLAHPACSYLLFSIIRKTKSKRA